MKNLKNIFLYLLLSIISIPSFSQVVPNYVPKQGLIDWFNLNGNLDGTKGYKLSSNSTTFIGDSMLFFTPIKDKNGTGYDPSCLIYLDQYDYNSKSFGISIDVQGRSSGKIFFITHQYNNIIYEDYSLNLDSTLLDINKFWNNIVISLNDNSIKVYINGKIKKDTLVNQVSSTKVTIGGYIGDRFPNLQNYDKVFKEDCFSGYINNIGLWNITLSKSQIDSISQITQTGISGTKLNPNSLISVYPNPASDYIIIDNNDYQNKLSVSVHNSLGQIVFNSNITESKFKINVDDLGTNGIYFVNIIKDGNIIDTKKIIIQK